MEFNVSNNSNISNTSLHRRKSRSSERGGLSPTLNDNCRKRPRTHSEPSAEEKVELLAEKENYNQEIPFLSELNYISAHDVPKATETVDVESSCLTEESALPDSTAETDIELVDNRGRLFEQIFQSVVPINGDFAGNFLCIIGTPEMAERIEKKFVIMQKLANLVGCGLDCHFRMAHSDYRLMMLVRGAPRVIFGTTVAVIPDLTDTRRYALPGEFVEAGQAVFFDSILGLLPRNLIAATTALTASLMKGEEDEKIRKLYEFLKNIRNSVLSFIATIPIVWTIPDFPSVNEDHLDIVLVRNVMKQCGDNRLLQLEGEKPGFTNMFCSICGLGPAQTFEQMMELKFNNFNMS